MYQNVMCYLLVEQIKSRNYISTTDISENLCNINKTNEDIINYYLDLQLYPLMLKFKGW